MKKLLSCLLAKRHNIRIFGISDDQMRIWIFTCKLTSQFNNKLKTKIRVYILCRYVFFPQSLLLCGKWKLSVTKTRRIIWKYLTSFYIFLLNSVISTYFYMRRQNILYTCPTACRDVPCRRQNMTHFKCFYNWLMVNVYFK
jgi:hypothetical protein